MNAIVGLSELLGRQAQTLPAQANNYIINIRRAGSSLLAIVNDVLDFARIESGNFEIVPDRYSLFSLVDDAIGVVKVRLLEKPVRLTVFLDSHSPKSLRGDAARIRQILLNLLVNAVKYTKEGSISLSVVARPRPGAVPPGSGAAGEGEGGQAVLEMKVADTGVGVRPEDLSRLFGDFERVDAEENRGVEGTGLGLAIARNLARLMGGDITATSERGRGTTFVVTLTQTIEDLSPVAQVENAAEKSVLVFERRAIYAKSLAENLDDFGVRHQVVNNYPDFYAALDKFEMTHMIMPVSVFIGLQNSLKERNVTAPLGLTTEDIHPFGLDNARYLNTPVYGRPLAAFLNNVSESPEKRDKGLVGPSFVAPEAQVLVVDDLPTDLMVAEGLFYPYGFKIELCRSGEEAIRKAKAGDYDMIFIDHLMPGMDGVEAAREIRDISEKYKNIPIVAMTANAAAEARETFLSQGLDDYLLKPIETAALNAILLRWIPLDKQEKPKKDVSLAKSGEGPGEGPGPALPNVVGLDAALGLSKANGRREAYLTTLEYFRKDALVSLTNLNASLENKEYRDFAVHAHALKSAAGVTGAVDLAARAAALEAASMARAEGFIAGNIASFRQDLLQLVDGLSRYFEALEKSGEKDLAIADEEVKRELGDLRDSLADLGEERIETALKGFLARKVGRGLRRDVEELARLYRESGVEALKAALDKTLTPTVH
jgi:CheY-like chemotaxis protein/nitrogen-specific signal transduction histidine kinase